MDGCAAGKSEGAASKSQYEAGESVDHENCICSATISVPISSPKVLMLELAESIAASTMLRHTPGITEVHTLAQAITVHRKQKF